MSATQEQIDAFIETQGRLKLAKQQLTVDGAKVVAVFTCGISATFTATALQVGTGLSVWDGVVLASLGVNLVITACVFVLDNVVDGPDLDFVAEKTMGDPDLHFQGLLTGLFTSVDENQKVLRQVFRALIWQCVACLVTIVLTVLSVA